MRLKTQTDFLWTESTNGPFHERLRTFRDSRGMSRAVLAAELGVTTVTLYRWETGSTRPSPVVTEKLGHLGFGSVIQNETNVISVPRLKSRARGASIESRELALRGSGRIVLKAADGELNILPAPFVRNGPPDQVAFHRRLLVYKYHQNDYQAAALHEGYQWSKTWKGRVHPPNTR